MLEVCVDLAVCSPASCCLPGKLLRLSMEEVVNFLQAHLERDFGYSDDAVMTALQVSMDELRTARLELPRRPATADEVPRRPFGLFVPPSVAVTIGRRTTGGEGVGEGVKEGVGEGVGEVARTVARDVGNVANGGHDRRTGGRGGGAASVDRRPDRPAGQRASADRPIGQRVTTRVSQTADVSATHDATRDTSRLSPPNGDLTMFDLDGETDVVSRGSASFVASCDMLSQIESATRRQHHRRERDAVTDDDDDDDGRRHSRRTSPSSQTSDYDNFTTVNGDADDANDANVFDTSFVSYDGGRTIVSVKGYEVAPPYRGQADRAARAYRRPLPSDPPPPHAYHGSTVAVAHGNQVNGYAESYINGGPGVRRGIGISKTTGNIHSAYL